MAEPIPALLHRALDLVERRRPDAYRALALALDGLSLSITAGGHLTLTSHTGRLHPSPSPAGASDLRLRTDRPTLIALVSGRLTLLHALRTGALDLAGTTTSLSRGLLALETLVGALLRLDEASALRRSLES